MKPTVNKPCANLPGWMNAQINEVMRFHVETREKIEELVDKEIWRQLDEKGA